MGLPGLVRRGAAVGAVFLALTACGNAGAGGDDTIGTLRFMVPNAAGSGWDTTARTAAEAMESAKLVNRADVFNVDGANGTVGLARLVNEQGNGEMIMQMGLVLVAATHTQNSQVTLADATPIAKLVEEYELVIVPADSPYRTVGDLVAAWKADPAKFPIGGGSSPGGADHLTPMLMAEAVGIAPRQTNYVSFGGGGLLPAVLGGQVAFGVTGAGDGVEQVRAGEVRALAVSGGKRLPALPDVPTLKESGVDVEFSNWRGVVAPPGLEPAERDALTKLVADLHASPQWQEAVERNGWTDAYVSGDQYAAFIKQQDDEVGGVLTDLGL